jgi:hypothetical protein
MWALAYCSQYQLERIMMNDIANAPVTYEHLATDPVTGEQKTFDEQFVFEPNGTKMCAYSVYFGKVERGSHYVFDATEDALALFYRERIGKLQQRAERWYKTNAIDRKVAADTVIWIDTIKPALELYGYDDVLGLEALENAARNYEAAEGLAAMVTAKYATPGAFRKAIRGLVSAGKEHARNEWEDEYRDSDDKDDFYTSNIDTVAEGIADSF